MKHFRFILLTSLLLGFVVFSFVIAMFYIPSCHEGIIWIEKGSSSSVIAQQMRLHHVPAYSFNLWLYKKLSGTTLKSGEYQLEEGWNLWQACSHIAAGHVILHKITIPEGWTVSQILNKLQHEPLLSGPLSTYQEGTLLPETYTFVRGDKRASIAQHMHQAMHEFIKKAWNERDPSLTLKLDEVVVLASIIECETSRDSEKPIISGVFHNRLARGMRLQSDPTVAYAITQGVKQLDKPLTYNDLRLESPFNTYIITGLPPQPIACPGKAAILATLHPKKHTYLYFVADGLGGHVFSHSYNDHIRHVQNWRRFQKKSEKK